MAATDPAAILAEHDQIATDLVKQANDAIQGATAALADAANLTYEPFPFAFPNFSFGSPSTFIGTPLDKPSPPNIDAVPTVEKIPTAFPQFTATKIGTPPPNPAINWPTAPSPNLPGELSPPQITQSVSMPNTPSLLPLGDTTLPYPTVSVPTAPVWMQPVFQGQAPAPLQSISLTDYLNKLTQTYASYSNTIPNLVASNWRAWWALLMQDHPNIATIQAVFTSYLSTGGAGIPVTIEQAIVSRAVDRTTGEARRSRLKVWDEVRKRGLWMPSGALAAGLKESAQLESEAMGKTATDLAVKHLDLEQNNMKIMLDLGRQLETTLLETSIQIAKVNVELNGQAIEFTKLVLTGMIEINNALVRIYQAQWDGYKSAVQFYQAQIDAARAQVQLYEAQISAEMAKVQIDQAKVSMIRTLVEANNALVGMYKAQIDAETAKLEQDRVRALVFESQTRGYVAQVEAYRARWDGFRAETDAKRGQAEVFTAQVNAYRAQVDAFRSEAEAYAAHIDGISKQSQAVALSNKSQLDSWVAKADGQLRQFVALTEAYRVSWQAAVEEMRIQAQYWATNMETVRAFNSTQTQAQLEMGRQHLTEWLQQLEAALRAAQGLVSVANVTQSLASSAMSGVTSVAATVATAVSS